MTEYVSDCCGATMVKERFDWMEGNTSKTRKLWTCIECQKPCQPNPAGNKEEDMTNGELYEKASKAIDDLFYDIRVSTDKCRANLENLIENIKDMLENISEDGGE